MPLWRTAVPDAAVRAFLLQNLHLGASPAWRIGLAEIIAALPVIEAWDAPADARYSGPTLFIAGAASDYIRREHRPVIRTLFPTARFVTLKNAGHWLHAENPTRIRRRGPGVFDSDRVSSASSGAWQRCDPQCVSRTKRNPF